MKKYLFLVLFPLFAWSGKAFAGTAPATEQQNLTQTGSGFRASLQTVQSWFERFEEYVSRTDVITPGELQKLPVGLRTTIGNYNYDLLFTDAVFSADYTSVSVYLRITGPDWQGEDRSLYFGVDDVLITERGGFIGDIKLALIGDVTLKSKSDHFHIRFLGRKENGEHTPSADGLPPTYAIVNCEGFKELQISGYVEFTDDNVVFIENGRPTDEAVRVSFFCNAMGIDDIVAKADIPEFTLKALPDWSFKAQNVMLDLSQRQNVPGFEGYRIAGMSGSDAEEMFGDIWQGLFIEDITLHFPDYIKKADGARPAVEAKKFWWDERGCTGEFIAKDLLRLDEGSLGGWGFSISEFSFDVKQNRLAGGGMKGEIEIPVSKMNAYNYEAGFKSDGSWDVKLKLGRNASFDFIKGRNVTLFSSSYLKVAKKADEDLLLQANLSGRMQLNPAAGENDNFGFANIEFSGLKIQNRAPYFEVSTLKWDDDLTIANFPVSIKDIKAHAKAKDISVEFVTQVLLGDKSDANFGGSLGLKINSSIKEEDNRQKWDFDGVDVNEVQLDFSNNYLTFKGGVRFIRNHKIYGDGFQGNLDFMINSLNFGLRADMMLGSTATYRYWYFDLLARLGPTGIPVFPGFKIAALGGGAYKHMSMQAFGNTSYDPGEMGERTDFGQTVTGLTYVPDSTKALGLKASVVLAMQEEKLFNADLTFEMLFNANGGVSTVGFNGVGKLLTKELEGLANFNNRINSIASQIQPDIDQQRQAAAAQASVTAKLNIVMDFENDCFTGLCDAYMDLGIIKGAGTGGHLGRIGMYFGRDSWYVKVGEPANPLAVKLKVGPLQAQAGAYFMTGSMLPDFPALPSKLSSLLRQNYPRPDLKVLKEGAGLAFGSNLNLSTGTIPCLILYGSFDAEIGFDIMMKQYPNALCAETGTEPGIKSWYADGQAYSYMMVDIGMYLRLFGSKRNFSVLRGEVGAMLRAGLPNPSSFAGSLGINVSLLNGLVKGRFNFDFDLGESCTIVNQGFADGATVINSTTPGSGEENVDVFSIPQAAFNLPVETEIEEEYDNKMRKLKMDLNRYELWYGGTKLKGNFAYEQDKRLVKFVSHEVLPSQAQLDFKLTVGAKEKNGSSWSAMKDADGNAYKEDKLFSFKTGKGPDSIPWSNVKYCYPVRDQAYFLPGESKNGFVCLERGMADLLTDGNYRKRVVLVSDKDSLEAAFTYDQSKKRLRWTMPSGLKPSTRYELRLVLKYVGEDAVLVGGTPAGSTSSPAQAATSQIGSTTLYDSDNGNLSQETVNLVASDAKSDKDKTVLRYFFTTSRYATFAEKMANVSITNTYRTPVIGQNASGYTYVVDPDVHYLQAEMRSGEAFCADEREGTRYSGGNPLIVPSADLEGEPYYQQDIYPLVYEQYPYGGIVQFEREENQTLIPDWAVYGSALYRERSTTAFPWIYCLPSQYKKDFNAILGSIASRSLILMSPYYSWLNKSFVPIRSGDYKIKLKYMLPDGTCTSESGKVFNNK